MGFPFSMQHSDLNAHIPLIPSGHSLTKAIAKYSGLHTSLSLTPFEFVYNTANPSNLLHVQDATT
jgi:hypothetical protein